MKKSVMMQKLFWATQKESETWRGHGFILIWTCFTQLRNTETILNGPTFPSRSW
jgi:hypothetical protein